ncbi:MFS transporter [Streptomyces sp. NPDC002643]
MMLSLSMIAGSGLAQVFSGSFFLAFLVPGLIGVVCVGLLVAVVGDRDRPARAESFQPYGFKEFLRSFWVNPRKHPDFAWNFAGRFLVFTGAACVTSYSVYFLMDRMGYEAAEVADRFFLAILVMVAATVVGSIVGGQLSDRSGRRKPYVLGSSLGMAVGPALVATSQSFGTYLLAMAVFGLAEGLYLSVDMALAAAVLPNPEESAKDMGVLNIGKQPVSTPTRQAAPQGPHAQGDPDAAGHRAHTPEDSQPLRPPP